MTRERDTKKEAHWRRLLEEQRRSGVSVAIFCRRRKIAVHPFYWWQRTLRERNGSVEGQAPEEKAGFVPVRLPLFGIAPIEVVHREGHVIRVPAGCDVSSLCRVLQALNASSPAEEA